MITQPELMPLEIKELHVKMVVDDREQSPAPLLRKRDRALIDENRLIEKCVEQVMQILKDMAER
jgi:hypothetical protein